MLQQLSGKEKSAVSDRTLFGRLQAGESDALGTLFRRHARVVFAYAYSRLSNRADAEEVLQDTFIVLWERRVDTVLATESALPWLLTTARYRVMSIQRSRRRARVEPLEERDLATAGDETSATAEKRMLLSYLEQAVASLPAIDQQIYDLCVQGDQSYAAAAAVLGISPAALRGRLARLRARLRGELVLLGGR